MPEFNAGLSTMNILKPGLNAGLSTIYIFKPGLNAGLSTMNILSQDYMQVYLQVTYINQD